MPPLHVLYHYAAGPRLRRRLDALASAGLEVAVCPEDDDARFFELLATTEVLWHCLRPVDRTVLAAAPQLRLVQKIGVGVNTIDLDGARERDVAVCNLPGSNSRAVAEHALGLMLAVLRRLPTLDRLTREGRGWQRDPALEDDFGEIAGRTVGLIGYGSVPRVLAPVLAALGARVLYTARTPKADAVGEWTSLDDLLTASDVVSLHVPATDATAQLLDARRLALLPHRAIVINTARGGLVDQAALTEALASGRLAGAGLDVFAEEPLDPDDPLLALPNVVLAPHVAWLTQETLERSLAAAVENCERLAAGRPLLHRVA